MPAAVHDEPVDDVLAIGGTTAFKLLVFHAERPLDALLVEVPALIAHLDTGFAVRHMGAEAAEIGPADDDKGAGLRWLCDHLGVTLADVDRGRRRTERPLDDRVGRPWRGGRERRRRVYEQPPTK